MNSSGDFLRADGHTDQPWSIKVSGKPLVYIENCLMDHLLSFFPPAVRNHRLRGSKPAEVEMRPAPWIAANGETITTLSPESRFQLASAILFIESKFHPNVSPSTAGALGAFQVLPTTGDQIGLPRVDIPGINLRAGLKYILYIEEQIAKHCDFDDLAKENSTRYRELIAASYNAGPGYLSKRDENQQVCRLEAFPRFSRTEYVRRFNLAMTYQFLPAYLNYDPTKRLLRQ